MSMSHRRTRQASPGRHPVSRWNSTSPRTWRLRNGQGGIHGRVIDRPDGCGLPSRRATSLKPGDGGQRLVDGRRTNSSATAQRNTRRTRSTRALTVVRHHPAATNCWRTAFNARGPNSAPGWCVTVRVPAGRPF